MKRQYLTTIAVAAAAVLLVPLGALAQQKDKGPPTLTDKDKELLKELEFIDEAEVKDETVKTGLEELLETVVVTATKQRQTIAAAPAIISVVTSTQIQTMGYTSVADALKSLPGFYLLNDHVEYNAGIRGVNGGQRANSRIIKVMIDGQPVSFRPTTGNWLGEELIPIDAVSRIEVIRGPNSALYGANAFLGVVNIITKSGTLVDGALVGGRIGMLQQYPTGGGSLVLGKKTGNVELLLSATGSFARRSGLEIGQLPDDPKYTCAQPPNAPRVRADCTKSYGDTAAPASLFMKLFYQSVTIGGISLDVGYQRKWAHGEFMDWGVLTRGRLEDPQPHNKNLIHLENLYIRSRISRTFLEDFSAAVSASFATMGPGADDQLSTNEAGLGVPDYFKRDFGATSLDLVAELTYRLRETSSFTLGTDVTLDWQNLQTFWAYTLPNPPSQPTLEAAPFRGEELGDERFRNNGVYFQSVLYPFQIFSVPALSSLGLTIGLRYDNHSIYEDAFNYRFGAVYLWRKLSGKILYGTSFKAPASVQLFTGRLRQTGGVIANPNLEPERAQTIEAQVGGELFTGFNGTGTFFYNIIDDKVELIEDPATPGNISAQNVAKVTGFGVEVDLGYTWRGLTSYANISYQKSDVELEDKTNPTNLYPDLMAKFGLAYSVPRFFLGGSVEGRYIGRVLSSEPNSELHDPVDKEPYELDPYFTVDLALYSVDLNLLPARETFMQFKVSNVTGAKYSYPGFKDYDVPALGRTLMFTLKQQL
jgi:iron complex outermembrane receptor protein